MNDHRGTEKSRCVRCPPAKRERRFHRLRALQSHPPSREFPCLPRRDLCRLQSRRAPVAIRQCRQLRPAPSLHSLGKRSRGVLLRPQRSAARNCALCARCRSLFHPPDKLTPAESHSRLRLASARCCSPRVPQSPSAPECRAPPSARFRRSTRWRPEQRHAYVSFFDRMNRINKMTRANQKEACSFFGRRNFFLYSKRCAPKFTSNPSSIWVATR